MCVVSCGCGYYVLWMCVVSFGCGFMSCGCVSCLMDVVFGFVKPKTTSIRHDTHPQDIIIITGIMAVDVCRVLWMWSFVLCLMDVVMWSLNNWLVFCPVDVVFWWYVAVNACMWMLKRWSIIMLFLYWTIARVSLDLTRAYNIYVSPEPNFQGRYCNSLCLHGAY